MVRGQWKKRSKEKKGAGLAQRVAKAVGAELKHKRSEPSMLRSEEHRKNVVALGCLITGRRAQAAHVNFGKGMGLKVCDSLTFPLCPELHQAHDQGGMPREERIKKEWEYVDATRSKLIRANKWPAEVEAAYQKAIVPLARMVHADKEKEKAA
ncbi:hypothetical protein CBF45_07450 [Bordetella sp. J329]|nr:hypothetical protein CBF45_07450 [Bordetella sp. J329]